MGQTQPRIPKPNRESNMTTAEPSSDATTVAPLTIADRTFRSRLILGTGKYTDSTR